MIPHSNAMDSQVRAQDLAATVLSASAPPKISAAISAVDAYLRRHPSDQSRSFFSISFPALILKLFAFDSSCSTAAAWIDLSDVKGLLFDLLKPDGVLFSAIAAVDAHSLVRYVFPIERLPEWMRYVLLHDGDHRAVLSGICPILKSRVKEGQFQLSVFEYYMFWFAYYPICKGSSPNPNSNAAAAMSVRKSRRSRLESWASALPGLSSGRQQVGQKTECSLYMRLLYAYLRAFVPKHGGGVLGSCVPFRSSLLHYSEGCDGPAMLRAEFLVHTFVQFWMVDNDFLPLPVSLCRSFGVSFPLRTVFGEAPPSAGLGEVLKLFVKYINSGMIPSEAGGDLVGYAGSTGQNAQGSRGLVWSSCDDFDGTWNLVMRRPLYRFILRTFLFCSMGTSMRNAAQVFSLWTHYLEPWRISTEYFIAFDPSLEDKNGDISQKGESQGKEGSKQENDRSKSSYSPAWQSYVLSNYLFYNSLVVHFLGFAHKFLHNNAEIVIQMVLKVLNILASSTELLVLTRNINTACHSKSAGSSSASSNSYYKCIPSIREQLLDWEDGLCETDADGSFLHENWNRDLRLFSEGEDGAHVLLQLLIVRAEPEIRTISGDKEAQNLQNLASIRAQMNIIFGTTARWSLSLPPTKDASGHQQERDEIFTPKHPGVGKRTWADVEYKGDWMRRPFSDSEVIWLAKLLVRLSDLLNEFLGLNRDGGSDESAGPTYIIVPPTEFDGVQNFKAAVLMLLAFAGSWMAMLAQVVLKFTRERGWRINLRVLASKKVVTALFIFVVLSALKRAFGMCCQSPVSAT